MDTVSVLLVDDEESFRQVLAKRLGLRGFTVSEAASGPEAMKVLAETPPQVMVLDVMMPDMNGLQVLERVRNEHEGVEVILLTGHASTKDGVAGMKAGAFDYLSKPVELDHLAGKIRQAAAKAEREAAAVEEAAFRERMNRHMVGAERLAALGTLAAGVAHEINNPLAVINDAAGWMQTLLEKPEADSFILAPKFAKGLAAITRSVERARLITHQLLGFARREETFLAETDLTVLAQETLQLVGKEARNKNVELSLESDPDTPKVYTDPNQIRQVLINLITNAIQAMDKNGRAVVRIFPDSKGPESKTSGSQTDPEQPLAEAPEGTCVADGQEGAVMVVEDNGPGIPEDLQTRIFEPFFSTKEAGVGTGLGLYVSATMVQGLGGSLRLQSEVGQGTTFTVRLPRSCPRPEGAEADDSGKGGDWFARVKRMVAQSEQEMEKKS